MTDTTTDITRQNWAVFTHEDISPDDTDRYVIDQDNTLIADCYADFPDTHLGLPTEEQYRANARLIAAAPNTLFELEKAQGVIRKLQAMLYEYGATDDAGWPYLREQERIAAIAKARGQA